MRGKSRIEKALEARHGDLHTVIPVLVNQRGQDGAARALSDDAVTVNQNFIHRWLTANGYTYQPRWERRNHLQEQSA